MKKLITILLFAPLFSNAQQSWGKSGGVVDMTITTITSTITTDVNIETDTIPLLLMGCDTFYVKGHIFYIKGHEVITKSRECCNLNAAYYWNITHIKYLDGDKKPFSNSIIVRPF